jgi:hypothetical protein
MKTTVRRDGTSTSPTFLSGRKSNRSLVGFIDNAIVFSTQFFRDILFRRPGILRYFITPCSPISLFNVTLILTSSSARYLYPFGFSSKIFYAFMSPHACYIFRLYQLPTFRLPKPEILNYRWPLYVYNSICFAKIINLMTDSLSHCKSN